MAAAAIQQVLFFSPPSLPSLRKDRPHFPRFSFSRLSECQKSLQKQKRILLLIHVLIYYTVRNILFVLRAGLVPRVEQRANMFADVRHF
jgi:hypothetical protein